LGEKAKMAVVYAEMGYMERSSALFKEYKSYADNDNSIYKPLSLAVFNAYHGEIETALEQLDLFAQQTSYQYLIIPFLSIDPLVDNIMELPEFYEIIGEMESRFLQKRKQIQKKLEKKGLL
jgi:hypothetical protein